MLDIISTIATVALTLTVLGFDAALMLFYNETDDPEQHSRVVATSLLFRLCVSALLTFVAYLGAPWFSTVLVGSPAHAGLLRLGILVVPFTSCLSFFLDLMRMRFQAMRFAVLSISNVFWNAVLGLICVVGLKLGVAGVFWGSLVSTSVHALVAYWLMRGEWSWSLFSPPMLRRMLAYGLPLVPASISLWVLNYSDRAFLAHYTSLYQVGVFTVTLKIASILGLMISAFRMAWVPHAFALQNNPDSGRHFSEILRLYLVLTMVPAVFISLAAKTILTYATTTQYADTYRIIGYSLISVIANGAYYIVSIGLFISKRTAPLTWTTIGVAALNIGLNILWIPPFGIYGLVAATLASQLVSVFVVYAWAQHIYPIPFRMGRAWMLVVLSVATIAAGLALEGGGLARMLLVKGTLVATYVAGLFLFRIVLVDEVRIAWRALQSILGRMKVIPEGVA